MTGFIGVWKMDKEGGSGVLIIYGLSDEDFQEITPQLDSAQEGEELRRRIEKLMDKTEQVAELWIDSLYVT